MEFRAAQGPKKGRVESEQQGTFWRSTLLERATRYRVARGVGKNETSASMKAFKQLKARTQGSLPPLLSDGWGGIREALIEVYGVVPPYSGRGRPPSRKQPLADWRYLQVIKDRDDWGRLKGLRYKAVFGELDELEGIFGENSAAAYVERTHLSMRQHSCRLSRKTLAFSRSLALHRAAVVFDDVVHNLVKPVRSLRRQVNPTAGRFELRYSAQTPAMAAGLTDRVWGLEELLRCQVVPSRTNT